MLAALVTERYGYLEDGRLPLSEFGMTICEGKAAVPNVVRPRDIWKVGPAMG
jgi:hypothetical protein